MRRFRSTYGLDEDHPSDVDSDEEEGVDNDARRLDKDNEKEKTFDPQRTSSPSLRKDRNEEVEARSLNNENSMVNVATGNNLCLRLSDDEDEPELEINDSGINPVKRKRKLFSTNCSYLEEDRLSKSEDPDEFDITPVRKKKIAKKSLEEIEEEEEDEQIILSVEEPQNQERAIEVGSLGENEGISSGCPPISIDDPNLADGEFNSSSANKANVESSDDIFQLDKSPLPAAARQSLRSKDLPEQAKQDPTATESPNPKVPDKAIKESRQSSKQISVTPNKALPSKTKKLLLKTPPSVCCKKVNTVDLDAMENLQSPKIRGRRKSSSTVEPEIIDADESIEKENCDKEFWYKSKFRQQFRRGEDESIVRYFLENGGYSIKGGNTVWKKMEEAWVCPGRTWGSLKERWDKHIELNLKSFGTSKKQLREKDVQKAASGRGARINGNYYSKAEDVKIVNFIAENKRFQDTKGNELWKVMEERSVLEGRSWQSMKERFRKVIITKITQYGFERNIVNQFSSALQKKPTKEKRIH